MRVPRCSSTARRRRTMKQKHSRRSDLGCGANTFDAIFDIIMVADAWRDRAKRIENRATVNQELSPAELKQKLIIANAELGNLRAYIVSLEAELLIWRSGA